MHYEYTKIKRKGEFFIEHMTKIKTRIVTNYKYNASESDLAYNEFLQANFYNFISSSISEILQLVIGTSSITLKKIKNINSWGLRLKLLTD